MDIQGANKAQSYVNFQGKASGEVAKKLPEKSASESKKTVVPELDNYKAIFAPNIDFTLYAKGIKRAYYITDTKENIPINKEADGSYIVNPETKTRVYFGKPAVEYLNSRTMFENDTQIIFPKKSHGIMIKDGKEIPLPQDSAVQITAGTKNTQILLDESSRSPIIYTSENDYDWYERYGKDAKNEELKKKFSELVYFASYMYNAKFTPNSMLTGNLKNDKYLENLNINKWKSGNSLIDKLYEIKDTLPKKEKKEVELVKGIIDKLLDTGLAQKDEDGYLRLNFRFKKDYQKQVLYQYGFTKEETEKLLPHLDTIRQARIDSKFARKNKAKTYGEECVKKMKQAGLIADNKKQTDYIFWKNIFGSEKQLVEALTRAEDKNGESVYFSTDEIKNIVNAWKKENRAGFDMTGMKYIDQDLAVYNLNDKINNWNQEETNWLTNSTALSANDGTTISLGASIVRFDKPSEIISMNKLRMGEALHKHPNKKNLKQYEVYFVTNGKAVLDVKKDGKIQEVILDTGDMAVIKPDVEHCVNVVKGKYEHICAQIPSAFHYGFDMKKTVKTGESKEEMAQRGEKAIQKFEEKKD